MAARSLALVAASIALVAAAPVRAQCPPATTHIGFHQQNTGYALAAQGDEAVFGQLSGFSGEVFVRGPDDDWKRVALLSGGLAPSSFGLSTDLRGDVLVFGDPFDESVTGSFGPQGAAAVFVRSSGSWMLGGNLLPPMPEPNGRFGFDVAISDDETRVVIGSPGASPAGAVWVYTEAGGAWLPGPATVPAGVAGGTGLGTASALFGGQLFLGVQGHGGTGAVFVLEETFGVWNVVDTLVPARVRSGDGFGAHLAGAGSRLFVAAPYRRIGGAIGAGVVVRYEKIGGAWTEVGAVLPHQPLANTQFGRSLDVDGNRLAVGAYGHAYAFVEAPAGWNEVAAFGYPDAVTFSDFGQSVALYSQGLLVGAPQYDDNGFSYPDNMGGVHTYDLSDYGNELVACGHSVRLVGDSEGLVLRSPANAGDTFIVLGSLTGTGPSLLSGVTLPLTLDSYFWHTLRTPNGPTLPNGLGALDGAGGAQAQFVLPSGLPPSAVGTTVHLAAVTFGPGGSAPQATNAVGILVVP